MSFNLRRVDPAKARGLGDKVLGLGKEIVGAVIGNQHLESEGESQQARGTEALKALRQELEGERLEAKAEAHERKERAAQRAKTA